MNEREAFEKWANGVEDNIRFLDDNELVRRYGYLHKGILWEAWQARAALASQEPVHDKAMCKKFKCPICCFTSPQAQPDLQDSVKLPTSADEAELMEKVGYAYLQQHAPERLVKSDLQDAKHLLELLKAANCPECGDKTGVYYDNNGEPTQCKWCFEVGQAMKAKG